jgi:hypothetical protein
MVMFWNGSKSKQQSSVMRIWPNTQASSVGYLLRKKAVDAWVISNEDNSS